MCLLNGDIGGHIPSSTDFGVMETVEYEYEPIEVTADSYQKNYYYYYSTNSQTYKLSTKAYQADRQYFLKTDNKTVTYSNIPVKDIIKELLHTYAQEPYHNIVLNDIEDSGLELLEYRGDTPIYMFYDTEIGEYTQGVMRGSMECYDANDFSQKYQLDNIPAYRARVELAAEVASRATSIRLKPESTATIYQIAKIEYGQTAGYRITDLTYAGELVSSVGESITSILDKIKNMLGDFEYFYDLDGRFIFQKKKTYIDAPVSGIETIDEDTRVNEAAYTTPIEYHFESGNLITAYQNNPNLLNLKNDYTVWGTRKSVTGTELPIHFRYAIDKKPQYYKAYPEEEGEEGVVYISDLNLYKQQEQEKKEEYLNNIKSFTPQYSLPSKLKAPQKQEDGSWSAGWWDIRDWAEFYYRITGEVPSYSMKWYSKNDKDIKYLSGVINDPNYTPGYVPVASLNLPNTPQNNRQYTWLVIYTPPINGNEGDYYAYNFQHGSGTPNINSQSTRTKYKSVYTERPAYDTYPVNSADAKVSYAQAEKKPFIAPYSGCTDSHTYLSFLEDDVIKDGNLVYFYNPDFPGFDSFDDIVDSKFEELMEQGMLQLVDWREIIYQMARDYYQYNQDDDFLHQIKNNNAAYYPTGITGYEPYYTDIQGFWRELYNPKESPIYKEYLYDIDNSATFSLLNEDGTPVNLGLKTKYILAATLTNPDRSKIVRVYNNELHDFIDTIPVNFVFNEDGTQDVYYVTCDIDYDPSGYTPITRDVYDQLEKKEIYVKTINGGTTTYVNLAYTVNLDDTCYLCEELKGDHVISVFNLPQPLQPLFFNTATNTYNKYISKHDLLLNGQKDTSKEPLKNYITYFKARYDYFQKMDEERYLHWNRIVRDAPDQLNFWFDFIDSTEIHFDKDNKPYVVGSELDAYAVPVVGDRTKVVNDKDVTSIYFREIPNLIFANHSDVTHKDLSDFTGYKFVYNISPDYFTISAQGKSAKDEIDNLLYQFSYCTENITLTSVPIYYLEPNVRILVTDDNSKINGEYLVSKITLPLAYNGTMSITATKAPTRLY